MKFNTPKFRDVKTEKQIPDIENNDVKKFLTNDGYNPVWGATNFTTEQTIPITKTFNYNESRRYQLPNWLPAATVNLDTSFVTGTTIDHSTGILNIISEGIEDSIPRVFNIIATLIDGAKTTYVRYTLTFTFQPPPVGQVQYEGAYGQNGGQCSYNWIAPEGVTSVNVLAIGGGGGGCYCWANCGGAGGGLSWANRIPVVPGQSYTILAGRGGCWNGSAGGASCFPGMCAGGGGCGCQSGLFALSSTALGTSCGGFGMVAYPSTAGGGGGGAGYTNGCCNVNTPGYAGIGGGGGSGAAYASSTYGSGGGGGTGICGQGTNGTCGNAGYSHQSGSGGGGGSNGTCGNPGEPWSNGQGNGYGCGGTFGGGGGGGGTSHGGGWGGPGAVRIIWGNGRCWPNTNTGNL